MPANRLSRTALRRVCCAANWRRWAIARSRSTISRNTVILPSSRLSPHARVRLRPMRSDPARREGEGLGDIRLEKPGHAVPGLVGAGDIVGGAALVGKGMRTVVAVDLVFDAGGFQCLFQIVDRGGCAPV